VEHFAEIALVTHLLGKQQPLSGQDLEKLMIVRHKYQGLKSAAPLPLAVSYGNAEVARYDGPTAVSEKSISVSSRVSGRSR
jgi:hypothetical protein